MIINVKDYLSDFTLDHGNDLASFDAGTSTFSATNSATSGGSGVSFEVRWALPAEFNVLDSIRIVELDYQTRFVATGTGTLGFANLEALVKLRPDDGTVSDISRSMDSDVSVWNNVWTSTSVTDEVLVGTPITRIDLEALLNGFYPDTSSDQTVQLRVNTFTIELVEVAPSFFWTNNILSRETQL